MDLKLKVYNVLCSTEIFTINSVNADSDDFGDLIDVNPELAEHYGCGNKKFIPKPSTSRILQKYEITADEYNEICNELEEKLSFGKCGWCI